MKSKLQTELVHHLLLEGFKHGYDIRLPDDHPDQPANVIAYIEEDLPLYAHAEAIHFIFWVFADFKRRRFGWGNLADRINEFSATGLAPIADIVQQAHILLAEKYDNPDYESWVEEWEYDQASGGEPCSLLTFIIECQVGAWVDLPHGLDPSAFDPVSGQPNFPF